MEGKMSPLNDYTQTKRSELVGMGMHRGIRYSHKMTIPELIKNLQKNDKDPNHILDKAVQAKCYGYHKKWCTTNRAQYNKYMCDYRYKIKNNI